MSEKNIEILFHWGSVVLIIIAGLIAIKILTKICMKALQRSSLDSALHMFICNALRVLLYIILIITVLGYIGVPTTTFIAVLGAAGAAIALALKDSLGNVAGGIIILVTKPFKQGDHIELNGMSGMVEHIDLMVTCLKTFDNKVVRVPNGTISNSILVNYSHQDERRVDCRFHISYNDSISKAKEILAVISCQHPDILKEPAAFIGVAGQEESSICLDLKVWCKTEAYWDVKYFLEENVKLAFDEAGITIPYPQMDVHVKK